MAVVGLGGRYRRRFVVDAEAAALLLGAVALAAVALGPAAAALAAAALLVAWTVSRLSVARRKTVVIGSPDFCTSVLEAAGPRRPLCETRAVTSPDDLVNVAPVGGTPLDVVVEGALVQANPSAAVAILHPTRQLRVIRAGTPLDTVFKEPFSFPQVSVKRALDVIVAVVTIVLVLPAMLVAMAAIAIESGRPVFFVQTRVGKGGRPFRLLKLRTMIAGGEAERREYLQAMTRGVTDPQGGVYKPLDHARVTRVGRVLRRFSLDEVPQLWNVLAGDMSVVGPRPPLVDEVEVYDDNSWQRLRVKPGLTGLAQISGRSELPFSQIVALDIRYATSWSPGMELAILARTPLAVLTARGAR